MPKKAKELSDRAVKALKSEGRFAVGVADGRMADLRERVLTAQGNDAAVTAMRRERELAAATKTESVLLRQVYAAEDAAERQAAAMDRVETARSALTDAYERESSALQSTIDKFDGFATSLRAFQEELGGGSARPRRRPISGRWPSPSSATRTRSATWRAWPVLIWTTHARALGRSSSSIASRPRFARASATPRPSLNGRRAWPNADERADRKAEIQALILGQSEQNKRQKRWDADSLPVRGAALGDPVPVEVAA